MNQKSSYKFFSKAGSFLSKNSLKTTWKKKIFFWMKYAFMYSCIPSKQWL